MHLPWMPGGPNAPDATLQVLTRGDPDSMDLEETLPGWNVLLGRRSQYYQRMWVAWDCENTQWKHPIAYNTTTCCFVLILYVCKWGMQWVHHQKVRQIWACQCSKFSTQQCAPLDGSVRRLLYVTTLWLIPVHLRGEQCQNAVVIGFEWGLCYCTHNSLNFQSWNFMKSLNLGRYGIKPWLLRGLLSFFDAVQPGFSWHRICCFPRIQMIGSLVQRAVQAQDAPH